MTNMKKTSQNKKPSVVIDLNGRALLASNDGEVKIFIFDKIGSVLDFIDEHGKEYDSIFSPELIMPLYKDIAEIANDALKSKELGEDYLLAQLELISDICKGSI